MAVSVAPGEGKFARFGVICSRKFSLLAVERNRARRLMWECIRLLSGRIMPCCVVLIPRRKIKGAALPEVMEELMKHLASAGVLKPETQEDTVLSRPGS